MTTAVILSDPKIPHSWKNDLFVEAREDLGWNVVDFHSQESVTTGDILEAAYWAKADFFIWPRYGHEVIGSVGDLYSNLSAIGTKSVAVHQDLYWGRPERVGWEKHPWWDADYVFTADGAQRGWSHIGINHHWIPPAIPKRFAKVGRVRSEYAHDIVFVGSCQAVHTGRAEILSFVQKRYGSRFHRYGVGGHGPIWGGDLADLYLSSKVVLGDSVDVPSTWSDRIPNTLGRGGILLHPQNTGLDQVHGKHLFAYQRHNTSSLQVVLDSALGMHPEDRKKMRAEAHEHIINNHLWSHRLQHIAAICNA